MFKVSEVWESFREWLEDLAGDACRKGRHRLRPEAVITAREGGKVVVWEVDKCAKCPCGRVTAYELGRLDDGPVSESDVDDADAAAAGIASQAKVGVPVKPPEPARGADADAGL